MTEGSARRLLLVEDDGDLRSLLAGLLEDAGFEVIQAEDGQSALEKLRTGTAPDAIILDLMMPRMTGWEFRARQKQDPALASTPVVVLSANTRAEARAMDADLFFTKPFELRELVEGLGRILSLRERRRTQEKLAHEDRMASLGTLAAGLAHEINSPLTGLLGSIDLAARVCRSPAVPTGVANVLERHLRTARDAASHIQTLIKNVSSFARSGDHVETLDVRLVLDAAASMIASEIEQHARVEARHEAVPPVRANRSHLLQIFLNLLGNAAHAVREVGSGTIRTRTFTSDAGEAVVEVIDTGSGIAPDHLPRVFDPFFTTKPPGQGTGLGLSLCHSLVAQLDGHIHVESELGAGSTFRVVLPPAASAERARVDPVAAQAFAPSRVRVLVVDDEPLVCSVLEHVLAEYEVVVTRNGQAAIEQLAGTGRFDVVLCDLNLTDTSGLDVYQAAIHLRPELREKFLIMTGGVRSPSQAARLEDAGLTVLQKPFELDTLLEAIDSCARSSRPRAHARGAR